VRKLAAIAAGLALGLAGCGAGPGTGGGDDALLILAASDLHAAFAEIETRYEAATGQPLTILFGSTGNIAMQIANGAPADLFFAANESFLDRLADADRIDSETRVVYAYGRLAIVWDPARDEPREVADLADAAFTTIAIGNPEHAPYGVAAGEALRSAGVWERVRPRLVYGENVAHALHFVRTGNADAGIIALGLVLGPAPLPHRVVPASAHAPLRQAAAVIRDSPRAPAARQFLDYVTGPKGQEILHRYGFDPPGG